MKEQSKLSRYQVILDKLYWIKSSFLSKLNIYIKLFLRIMKELIDNDELNY